MTIVEGKKKKVKKKKMISQRPQLAFLGSPFSHPLGSVFLQNSVQFS